jgi:hypothetical protein
VAIGSCASDLRFSHAKDAMNEAMRDWVTNVGYDVLYYWYLCRSASLSAASPWFSGDHRYTFAQQPQPYIYQVLLVAWWRPLVSIGLFSIS